MCPAFVVPMHLHVPVPFELALVKSVVLDGVIA